MTVKFLGYKPALEEHFELRPCQAQRDFTISLLDGAIMSWPRRQSGEIDTIVGVRHDGLRESFYSVSTLDDVNHLREHWDSILNGRLRLYGVSRVIPSL